MIQHDNSKLEEPELSTFDIYTDKLKGSTYGSDEYKQFLKEMKPALDHHYANNRHHPELSKTIGLTMDIIESQQQKIEDLTAALIKTNKKWCPERAGYETDYKYKKYNCDSSMKCHEACWRISIEKGIKI